MNQEQVVRLMSSSRNSDEWNANADEVKKACGGYPQFWYEAIMMSGIAHRVQQSWLETAVALPNSLRQNDPNVFTLNPPTPEEIEKIRQRQA